MLKNVLEENSKEFHKEIFMDLFEEPLMKGSEVIVHRLILC